jgi:hypothetical protein
MQSRKTEARRAAGVSFVLLTTLLLANLPYLYGYFTRPPGTLFWAVPFINYADAGQYLAFTRLVREGRLLVGDPFTSEPSLPRLFLPEALWEAALCRLLGWSPLEAYQASRALFGAALLLAGCWLGMRLLPRWRLRWLYLGFLCFSAGAGWFMDRLNQGIPHGDFLQPEGNTFHLLGNLPHLALAAALLTFLFGTLLALEQDGSPVWLVLTGAASALLSWTHPFDFATLALGLGSYALARWVEQKQAPRASLLHAGALVLGAVPAGAYLAWLTHADPVYRALANDALTVHSPSFYLIAHGPLALPALLVLLRRDLRSRYLLPLCWGVCVFVFLLAPLRLGGKQCRLVGGVHVPLALLAAVGTERMGWMLAGGVRRARGSALSPRRGRRLARRTAAAAAVAYLLLTATGGWGIFQRHLWAYARRSADFYLSPGVLGLFQSLDREGDEAQVTLGGPYTGGWAPVLARTRSFHGHWHMTLNEPRKRAERDWFFAGAAYPGQRAEWLRRRGITWVVWYPAEWGGSAASLEGVPGLKRVYSSPEIVLYRFGSEGLLPPR